MDSNFQKCTLLASFLLSSARIFVALLVIEVSPMVVYPFLRLVGWFEPLVSLLDKLHFPTMPHNERANNPGITPGKIPYRNVHVERSKGPVCINEPYAYYIHERVNTQHAFASTLTTQESVSMHDARKESARPLAKAGTYIPQTPYAITRLRSATRSTTSSSFTPSLSPPPPPALSRSFHAAGRTSALGGAGTDLEFELEGPTCRPRL